MLDACPHHHEEEKLDGLTPRSPRSSKGKRLWRSLDELAQTPEFEESLRREFPREAGFDLLVEDGRLSHLEGYTFDDPWPPADE